MANQSWNQNWNQGWGQQQQQKPPAARPAASPGSWSQGGQQSSWPQQQPAQAQTQRWPQQQQQGGKGSAVAQGGKGAPAQAADALVVSAGPADMQEVVIRTLVGEYRVNGENHGHKTYKKVVTPGSEGVDVFMYYWDSRDGDAFEGWWFGNELGGTQVWSHVKDASLQPPASGWKIPWDGAVRPSLTVQAKGQEAAGAAAPSKGSGKDKSGYSAMQAMQQQKLHEAQLAKQVQATQANAKIEAIKTEVASTEAAAQTALEQAKGLAGDFSDSTGIKHAEELLAPQVAALTQANKRLMEGMKGTSGEVAKNFSSIAQQLRASHAAVNAELGKLRAQKVRAEQNEKKKAMEEKDMVLFQQIMPEAIQKTNTAEDAVEKAAITAEMITSAGDDLEEARQAVDQTEKAAKEAQTAIGEARIYLNAKLASAKRFESEGVRKNATDELGKLQAQLQEAQTKLTPLKTARQDFIQKTAAQKLVTELKEKLTPAEVDVDKAEEANAILAEAGENKKEALAQAEQALKKAEDHIGSVVKFIDLKKKSMPAQGVVRTELLKYEQRCQASSAKLQKIRNSQKEALEAISCSTLAEEAAEKLKAVEEAVEKVEKAEEPFLTGLEELPLDDTLKAVKELETAATSANTTVSIARMFIATKLVEVKRFTSASSKPAQAKLTVCQKKLEVLTQKLTKLKKTTAARKKEGLMRESEGCVAKAEEAAKAVAEAGALFNDDAKMMECSSEELKNAGAETAKAEAAANAALAEARKFITARQIEAKGKDTSEEVSAVLTKYQQRLSAAQTEVSKYKKLSATVEQRLAAKKHVEDAVNKVTAVEEKITNACKLATELNDMSPEGVGEKGYQEAVKTAEAAATAATSAVKQVERYLASQSRLTGPSKDEIAKLTPRVEEAKKKLEESAAAMRERSEKLVVEGILAESEKRVTDAENAVSKAKEAEGPLAKVDELPPEEATAAIEALDKAVGEAHTAVGGTKTFLAMKRLAAKRLVESAAKATTEELSKHQARLDEVTKKLQEVKKGMAERKAGQIKQQMTGKVIGVEKKVAEAEAATKALEAIEAEGNASAEKAKAECEKLAGLEKEAQKLMDDALSFLVEKQKDVKNSEEETKALQTRLTTAQSELAKSKKALSEFEQRFVAQKLLGEANAMIEALEAEVAKVKASAAPLLEEGGARFLASTTVASMAEALKEHMQKAQSTKEALFEEAGGKKDGKIAKDAFMSFIDKLPDKLSNEDLAYPEDQRSGIFSHIDADGDGEISLADFEQMFSLRYMCVKDISITDGKEIAKSKTLQKLSLDDVVEILGDPHEVANGVTRVECKAVESGKQGWVTLKGNQGTAYLELYSPYNTFVKSTERLIESLGKTTSKANSFVKGKANALANTPRGPLADARTKLMELKPKVTAAQKDVESLKKGLADSQKEYARKQELAIEAKDRKAAALLIKGVKEKMDAMEANAEKLIELTKTLLASGADLESIATPLTISVEAETVKAAVAKDCAAARQAIAEQREALSKEGKTGPMREAKQEMAKYMIKIDAAERKSGSTTEGVRKACASLAASRLTQASIALRADMLKRAVKLDDFFAEVSGGKDTISEDAFTAHLKKLEGVNFPDEHLKLLMQHVDSGGISRRRFDQMVQKFYSCVKTIAITNEFAISKSKSVRMLDLGEVIEVLEGPTADPKLKIERVKGRALADGAEGWISMQGNQGTPFLKDAQKPCYYCAADVALDKEFRNANGDPPLKMLKATEVLEVMEGPKKDSFEGAFRAKGKACKDGAVGWFVLKTKEGTPNAEQSGKYYTCSAAIAMTDGLDIKACKVVRKLDVGETALVLEGPAEHGDVHRIRCKSMKDGQEGWITIKGNKGTVYAEESSTKLYTLANDVPLQKNFETDAANLVRQLEKGEAIEVTEGPKQEKFEVTRLRARAVSDASDGWVTVKATTVKPWSPHWKCVAPAELTPALRQGDGVEALRKLEAGESVEVLDGPKEDAGVMRARVRAGKDSAVGWVTMRSAEGTAFLEHKRAAAAGK